MDLETLETELVRALNNPILYDDLAERRALDSMKREFILASVLLLVGINRDHKPCLLYTKRTNTVDTHKGQISFPGGHSEVSDGSDVMITALRETEEEVGIYRSQITMIGRLPDLHTMTGFLVSPCVGILKAAVEDTDLSLDTRELEEAMWISLTTLKEVYRSEIFYFSDLGYPIHVYQIGSHRIWGLTGTLTKNLLDRLAPN